MRRTRIVRVSRWLLLTGACLFLVAQFVRPAKTNPVADPSLGLECHVELEPEVSAILERSCVDCHSNNTRWPWYANVAPVSWFVIDHVNHGRSHLNFSEWGTYEKTRQRQLLKNSCAMIKRGEMPLSSYTPMHPESKLTAEDVATICEWTSQELLRSR